MQEYSTDILILGAGIGGYETYRSLARALKRAGLKKKITVVDEHNYFTFTPMLHEAATGSVEPNHCAIPLRSLVKTPHQFLKTRVEQVLPEENLVKTSIGTIRYEFVVVALGSSVNYFNTPGARECTYQVRTLPGAMRLQSDFIAALESDSKTINVVVVGGGWTGVEVAGQYSHFIKTDIKKLYPEKKVQVTLVQAGQELVPALPTKVRSKIKSRLLAEKVALKLGAAATLVTPNSITLSTGETLSSDFTIWTAGFSNAGLCYVPEKMCSDGRIPVNSHLHHPDHPNLYAVGDIILGLDAAGKPYPQLGEAAHKEGQFIAKDIVARLTNHHRRPFHFKKFGTLLPLGNWYAVAIIGQMVFTGRFAWWIRRTAYLLFIPGFWRKLKIMADWTLHSFTHRYILDIRD